MSNKAPRSHLFDCEVLLHFCRKTNQSRAAVFFRSHLSTNDGGWLQGLNSGNNDKFMEVMIAQLNANFNGESV